MAAGDLAARLAALPPVRREALLARLQERAVERALADGAGLERMARDGPLPLSFGQQQLWLLEKIAPGLPLYNVAAAVALSGALRVEALAAALRGVLDRHEALRTSFVTVEGEPRQVARPAAAADPAMLPVIDLAALPAGARDREALRLRGAAAALPFDLARGRLLRALLLRLGGREHLLALTLHHIASDGWSIGILVRELAEIYAAAVERRPPALAPLPVQYADYAAFQRRRLAGERRAALVAYWRERLSALPPPLPLPLDRPRAALRSPRGAHRRQPLPGAAVASLAAGAEALGATPFMALLAAGAALLLRYSGEEDVLIGAPVTDRRLPEVEGLIGYFVNTLVLRLDLAGDPPFAELVGRVRETALAAFAHQEMPFELLVEELRPERDLAVTPVFQVTFALHEAPALAAGLDDLTLTSLPAETGAAKFDLSLTVEKQPGAWETAAAHAEYAADLFEPATISRLLGHFAALVAAAAAAPGQRLSELALLAPSERQQLLREWNDTAAPPAGVPMPWQIAAQARRTPGALAVADGSLRLTYGELLAQAGLLSRRLAAAGVSQAAETRVALCLGRSAAEVAAMLAVLAAGGAYVPLDPGDPDERLAWIARDSGARLLLARGERANGLAACLRQPGGAAGPAADCAVIDLDDLRGLDGLGGVADGGGGHAAGPSGVAPLLDALAYVIYTSGSTGQPKGVAVTHGGLANFAAWQARYLGISSGDRTTHLSGPAFDATGIELWPFLAVGAAVEVIDDETRLRPAALGARLAAAGTTVCFLPTPLAEALLAGWTPPPRLALRILATGGDRLRRLPPRPLPFGLVNLYGPTETTVVATAARLAPGAARGGAGPSPLPPIGRPIDSLRVHVLDRALRPAPQGAAGELCVAGCGLARGYLGRPAETAASFVPNPWADLPGGRLYRTGDRARHLADGSLEHLGRLDRQVKVRGFRVEPGEVEAALAAAAEVAACAVVVREDLPGGAGLVAYVVPSAGGGPPRAPAMQGEPAATAADGDDLGARLLAALARRLPAYLMPALMAVVPELPLTANGKTDRAALARWPIAAGPAAAGAAAALPRGEVVGTIAAAWRAALGRDAVGTGENFFNLGGHSLLLVEVHSALQARFPQLQILDLFRYPTIAALAAHLAGGETSCGAPEPAGGDPPGASPMADRPVAGDGGSAVPHHARNAGDSDGDGDVAIVGMAGRFPGAAGVAAFWRNLMAGVESIARLSPAELDAAGVSEETRSVAAYVPVAATVDGFDEIDAQFFGLTPREAEAMDPQHRLFLECAWEALENAGYDARRWPGRIGVYAGAGMNSYFRHVLASSAAAGLGEMQAKLGIDKDFLTTRVSYRLGLEGPSVAVQTACSTSLVAVHIACQALLAGECDMALAGGVSLRNLYREGYLHEAGGVLSPDGHCRAFDAAAGGTVPGDGVALVVLKRLADARAAGDAITAVIKGSAINNDGAAKVGYTAPGLDGQAKVVRAALAAAGVDPRTIAYVETHGTGTALGDPIEVAALGEAFAAGGAGGAGGAARGEEPPAVVLGAVKTNIGHLDSAAGVAGLIKAALALHHGVVPPTLHFTRANPRIAGARFRVRATAVNPWQGRAGPRRAAVSSFGIGGTNAHVILEAAGEPGGAQPGGEAAAAGALGAWGGWHLLQLSARTATALARAAAALGTHLEERPEMDAAGLAAVAFTLRAGRRAFEHRAAYLCRDAADARAVLAGGDPARALLGRPPGDVEVAFLLPGQGAQRVGMAESLYRTQPVYRAALDEAADLLAPQLGRDLRELLFPRHAPAAAAALLDRTLFTQPVLFAVEHALARMWMAWGVRPAALLGHSVGELVAACLAGVFTLPDALSLVALRGRLVEEMPPGAMLSVPLGAADLAPFLGEQLSLAAANAADRSVAAGPAAAIADLEERLAARGVQGRRLRASHAFHSPLVAPAAAPLERAVAAVQRRRPAVPFISCVTGTWITAEEATDPAYWSRQLLAPVQFAAGLRTLAAARFGALLEVGPGTTLSRLARRRPEKGSGGARPENGSAAAHPQAPVLSTLPESPSDGAAPDAAAAHAAEQEHVLRTIARLWLAGAPLDPYFLTPPAARRRVPLPTYPFERRRYWLPRPDPRHQDGIAAADATPAARPAPAPGAERRPDPADWCYLPSWRRSLPPLPVGLDATAPPAPALESGLAPQAAGSPAGDARPEPEPPVAWAPSLPAGDFLLFGDAPSAAESLTAALAGRLQAAGRRVTIVCPGVSFAPLGDGLYTVRPGEAADYDALLAALAAAGREPATILHLWSAAEPAPVAAPAPAPADTAREPPADVVAPAPSAAAVTGAAAAGGADIEHLAALEHGFYSLMALAGSLARAAGAGWANAARSGAPLNLWVVSRRVHDVAGGEAVLAERAAILGPCRVIPLELPGVICRGLDLPPLAALGPAALDGAPVVADVADVAGGEAVSSRAATAEPSSAPGPVLFHAAGAGTACSRAAAEAAAAALVLAEVAARPAEPILAYRGGQRWVEDFAPVPLPGGAAPRLRPGGVYLITGGLGGVGQALARRLARAGARLVLIGRAGLPPREEWDQILAAPAGPGAGDPRALRVRRLRELEEGGAEVLWVAADVTDRAALRRLRAEILERFGALHGIVHAAGVPGGGILQLRRRAEASAVLAPKVAGTRALAEVFPPAELDFFALCSSLNSVLGAYGQADYCAANAFLDAFAASQPGRVLSISWDRWDEAGMAAEASPVGAALLATPSGHHPLLGRRLAGPPDQVNHLTRLSATSHWVLDEHRLNGMPLLPGTAYLELARAALAAASGLGRGGVVIRHLTFVAPLAVPDGETLDVFTTLRRRGDGWDLRIASRTVQAGVSNWREHAIGEVAPPAASLQAAAPPPRLSDLLAAMPPVAVLDGAEAASAKSAASPPSPAAGATAASPGSARSGGAPGPLVLGPRWQVLRAAASSADGDEFLARLELPPRFAADLESYLLHPALLDLATGFARLSGAGAGNDDAARPYFPFSYSDLRLARPLPAVIYSHLRRRREAGGGETALRYAVTLYDEGGEVLLTLGEYTFLRAAAPPRADAVPAAAASLPASLAAALDLAAAADEETGLSTAEGVEVFDRILARLTVPQVLISVRDLRARSAAAAARGGEKLLAAIGEMGGIAGLAGAAPAARHPRPDLGVPYVAPQGAVEEHLAEVWQELLGIDLVGTHDDFFELGGDSVLGLRIAALARERGLTLSPNELFSHPTVAGLAARLEAAAAIQPLPAPAAVPVPRPVAASHSATTGAAGEPEAYEPDDFPDAEVSARDLGALLAQLGAGAARP